MEAIHLLQDAVTYMEEHLLESISYEATAKSIGMSSYNFHRIFSFMAGMTASEYIRNRRLSLAGQELLTSNILVIEAAYKYSYDTPESFSKPFSRFHGVSPKQAKHKGTQLRLFNPLAIKITMEGGNIMNYKIVNKESQKFIAIIKALLNVLINDENDHSIPDFWTECYNSKLIERLQSLRPKEKRDTYGLCSPT